MGTVVFPLQWDEHVKTTACNVAIIEGLESFIKFRDWKFTLF